MCKHFSENFNTIQTVELKCDVDKEGIYEKCEFSWIQSKNDCDRRCFNCFLNTRGRSIDIYQQAPQSADRSCRDRSTSAPSQPSRPGPASGFGSPSCLRKAAKSKEMSPKAPCTAACRWRRWIRPAFSAAHPSAPGPSLLSALCLIAASPYRPGQRIRRPRASLCYAEPPTASQLRLPK